MSRKYGVSKSYTFNAETNLWYFIIVIAFAAQRDRELDQITYQRLGFIASTLTVLEDWDSYVSHLDDLWRTHITMLIEVAYLLALQQKYWVFEFAPLRPHQDVPQAMAALA